MSWIFGNDEDSSFTLSNGTKIIIGLFGTAAMLYSLSMVLKPVQEIFDDLHHSDSESENEF